MNTPAWVRLFNEVYLSKYLNPYMHVLMNHVHDALRLHRNISNFPEQGLEKFNDNVTSWFFRSSSHIRSDTFRQVMQKQNRIHHLASTCQRVNVSLVRQICKKRGRNERTCAKSHKQNEVTGPK